MQQPSSKKLCLQSPDDPQQKDQTDPPFSYLPPDVVVDEIFSRVIFYFTVMEGKEQEEEVTMVNFIIFEGYHPVKKWKLQSPFFCFGRFCRDGLRFSWFVFRSLHLPAGLVESGKIVLCRSKMVHLIYNWCPPRSACSLPRMPILRYLELWGIVEDPSTVLSLARPNHFPCLESLQLSLFNRGVESLILHPSNAQNFRAFGFFDFENCLSFSGMKTFLHSLPFVNKLTRLGPIVVGTISDLALLVRPLVNLVILEVSCDSSTSSDINTSVIEMTLPCLKRLHIRTSREQLIGAVGFWKMSELQSLDFEGFTDYSAFLRNVGRLAKRDQFFSSLRKLTLYSGGEIINLYNGTPPSHDDERIIVVWWSLEIVHCYELQTRSFFNTCKFPKLKSIVLMEHDDFFPPVHLPSVEEIRVEQIDSEFFERSECVKSLKTLDVDSGVSQSSAVPLPRLKCIRMSNWTGIQNLFRVLRSSSRVREVKFGRFPESIPLTADALDSRILRTVDLRHITVSPYFFDRQFLRLVSLTLYSCRDLTRFPMVVGQFPVLKRLHLGSLNCVTDSLFREPSSFPSLEDLCLRSMVMLTGTDWCIFPQLKDFNVTYCDGMGNGEVFQSDGVRPRFPALKLVIWDGNGNLPLIEDLRCIDFPMLREVNCRQQRGAFSHMFKNHPKVRIQ